MRRVSVPSDLITAVPVGSMTIQSSKADLHPVVENQRMEDTGPFLVSFPLSVFMLSEVHTGCPVVKAENDNPPFYVHGLFLMAYPFLSAECTLLSYN